MSPDNWAICPQCVVNREINYKAGQLAVAEAYGKLPMDEYVKLVEEANKKHPPLGSTLREDYEIYMNRDGTFRATYNGYCEECGFEHTFDKVEKVNLKTNPA